MPIWSRWGSARSIVSLLLTDRHRDRQADRPALEPRRVNSSRARSARSEPALSTSASQSSVGHSASTEPEPLTSAKSRPFEQAVGDPGRAARERSAIATAPLVDLDPEDPGQTNHDLRQIGRCVLEPMGDAKPVPAAVS